MENYHAVEGFLFHSCEMPPCDCLFNSYYTSSEKTLMHVRLQFQVVQ